MGLVGQQRVNDVAQHLQTKKDPLKDYIVFSFYIKISLNSVLFFLIHPILHVQFNKESRRTSTMSQKSPIVDNRLDSK